MELQASTNAAGAQHTSHPVIDRAAWHKFLANRCGTYPGLFAWHIISAAGNARHPGQQSDNARIDGLTVGQWEP